MTYRSPFRALGAVIAAALLAAPLLLGATACGDGARPVRTGAAPKPGDPTGITGGAAAPAPTAETPRAWSTARLPYTAADGSVSIWFTRPGSAPGEEEDPEADDAVAAAILSATQSVDLCLYEFDRHVIVDAAVDAASRGVPVRFVGDGDEEEDDGYVRLLEAGVDLALRPRYDRIMHNKFVVVDGRWVFTGSTNVSDNGLLKNNNNLLVIDNETLAAAYTAEFQQMYDERRFGRSKVPLPLPGELHVGGRTADLWFSPQDEADLRVQELLATADHSVLFLIFSFTHQGIADSLIGLHGRGVEVVGVFDESQARGRYSADEYLAGAGVPVFIDGNENASGFAGGKLHHKVMIVDGGTDSDPFVITGSYNWSISASEYNDENVLVLRGADIVLPYLEEFCRRLDEATVHPEFTETIPDPCARLVKKIRFNEVMPNPDGADADEEYVEIVNAGVAAVDMTGWQVGDATRPDRHVFGALVLPPGGGIVVWSGPAGDGSERIVATTEYLGLANNADEVVLRDADGVVIDRVAWQGAESGVSFNRNPDGSDDGPLDLHTVHGTPSSPGARADGTPWDGPAEPGDIVINELLPDPDGYDAGNEFVEVVNVGFVDTDLTGWALGDALNPERHVFAAGTVLAPGAAAVVFDAGGHHPCLPGAASASSGSLSLNNGGDVISLRDADGAVVDAVVYDAAPAGASLNRAVDATAGAAMVPHDEIEGALGTSSPGRRADGFPWAAPLVHPVVVVNEVLPDPDGTDLGQEFVELVNVCRFPVDVSGWSFGDESDPGRHTFANGALLASGAAVVVFDRGEHPDVPTAIESSTGTLSLNNGGDTVTLRDAVGDVVSEAAWADAPAGESLNRAEDGDPAAALVPHSQVPGAAGLSSPGLRADGSAWE